jgi:putative heme degradation protein
MAERPADLKAKIVLYDINWESPEKYDEAKNLGEVAKEFEKKGIEVLTVIGNIGDVQATAGMCIKIEEKNSWR